MTGSAALVRAFRDLAAQAAEPAGLAWLDGQLARLAAEPATLARAFTAARRRLGTGSISAPSGSSSLGSSITGSWRADVAGRVALVLAALPGLTAEAEAEALRSLYLKGELEERRAVLRALPHLPHGQRHIALAVEACRTNAKDMFEAIACENPFPARHFEALPFQQMVLKSLFMNLDASRIVGLEARITGELLRMLDDFDAELTAAGRPLPSGMAWIRSHAP